MNYLGYDMKSIIFYVNNRPQLFHIRFVICKILIVIVYLAVPKFTDYSIPKRFVQVLSIMRNSYLVYGEVYHDT